jgi:hypothetical protein
MRLPPLSRSKRSEVHAYVHASCSEGLVDCAEHWDEREDQMFDVTHSTNHADDQVDGAPRPGAEPISGSVLQQLADAEVQRIYLPRGPAQSRCEPPSYYYLASDSGAVPSWVVDEACRKRLRGGAH